MSKNITYTANPRKTQARAGGVRGLDLSGGRGSPDRRTQRKREAASKASDRKGKTPFGFFPPSVIGFYKSKRVLITGAGGYIGSSVARFLSELDCDLILQTYHNSVALSSPKSSIVTINADFNKPDFWTRLLDKRPDIVFHFAENDYKDPDPAKQLSGSALLVLRLLEYCKKASLRPKIIFASSSNLVGWPNELPVTEDVPDAPLTMYAIHKLLAEKYLSYYSREFGFSAITLRLANVYGPTLDREVTLRAVVNRMIAGGLSGKLQLYVNRSCVRDYVYIDDVVDAFIRVGTIEVHNRPYYLIGSGAGITIEALAKLIAEILEKKGLARPSIDVDDNSPVLEVEKRNFVADTANFRNITQWRSDTTLEQGIGKTVDYFLSRKSQL